MPNFLQQFRMPNFFSPNPKPEQQMPSSPYSGLFQPRPTPTPAPQPMPMQQQQPNPMAGLMNAPTPAMDRYNEHLSSMPRREDNQLGLVGKILAGVAGGSAGISGGAGAGFNTTQGLLDSRYNRALDDYDQSGQNLGQLADSESYNLDRQNQLAIQMDEQRREAGKDERDWRDLARKEDLSAAQVKRIEKEITERGFSDYTDHTTGMRMRLFEDGQREEIGKVSPSANESAASTATTRANRQEDAISLIDHRAKVDTQKPRTPLAPSQEANARENAMLELVNINPQFRGMLDDNGMREEDVK